MGERVRDFVQYIDPPEIVCEEVEYDDAVADYDRLRVEGTLHFFEPGQLDVMGKWAKAPTAEHVVVHKIITVTIGDPNVESVLNLSEKAIAACGEEALRELKIEQGYC